MRSQNLKASELTCPYSVLDLKLYPYLVPRVDAAVVLTAVLIIVVVVVVPVIVVVKLRVRALVPAACAAAVLALGLADQRLRAGLRGCLRAVRALLVRVARRGTA